MGLFYANDSKTVINPQGQNEHRQPQPLSNPCNANSQHQQIIKLAYFHKADLKNYTEVFFFSFAICVSSVEVTYAYISSCPTKTPTVFEES